MRGGVAFYRLLSLSGLLNPPTPLKLVPRIEGGGAGAAYAGRGGEQVLCTFNEEATV
jgi:hypothetical protein